MKLNIFLFVLIISSCSKIALHSKKDQNDQLEGLSFRKDDIAIPGPEKAAHKKMQSVTPGSTEKKSLEELKKDQFVMAMNKLQNLIKEAKKVGPHAVDYLATDLFLKANAAGLEGDYATSIILLKHLISFLPTEHFLKLKYAVLLIKLREFDEAKKILEQLYSQYKYKQNDVGILLAGLRSAYSDNRSSKKIYKEILARDPSHMDACILLAKTYSVEKKLQQSLNVLSRCSKHHDDKSVFLYYKGRIALELDRIQLSEKFFSMAIKENPDNFESVLGLGIIYESHRDYARAIKVYRSFLERNPSQNIVLTRIIESLITFGNHREAVQYMEHLERLNPSNIEVRINLGILYTELKLFEKAQKILNEVYKTKPNVDKVLFYLGVINFELKQYNKGIGLFSKIKKDSSLYLDSVLQKARAMVFSSSFEEDAEYEEQFFTFLNEKMKEHPEIELDLALVKATYYENNGNFSEAVKIIKSMRKHKKYSDNNHYYLASLLEKQKKFDEAASIMFELLKKNHRNAHAWNFLGYSLLERDSDIETAYKYIEKAISLKPNDGFILDSLGWYYYKIGKYRKALKYLKMAKDRVITDGVIFKHLGIVYQALNEYDSAEKYFKEALKQTKMKVDQLDVIETWNKLKKSRMPAKKRQNLKSKSKP